MLMVAKLYAGALVESPDVPRVGWRVGAYVGRSCAVMPSLAYGASDMPDSAALADAAPYVDDPAMRCFASRLRRREPLRIAVFGTSVVAGNRCNKQNGANFPQVLPHHLPPTTHLPTHLPTHLATHLATRLPTNADPDAAPRPALPRRQPDPERVRLPGRLADVLARVLGHAAAHG